MAPRVNAKRRKLEEEESIDSDEFDSELATDAEEEPTNEVVMSAEEKRLLMAKAYMAKMGISYDGADDLENVSRALALDQDAKTRRTIELAKSFSFELGRSWSAKNHRVTCVEIAHDDAQVFTGGKDGKIAAWDLATGARLGFFGEGHPGGVTALALATLGKVLVSVGRDHCLKIWDVAERRCVAELEPKVGSLNSVSVVGDLVFVGADKKVVVQYSLSLQLCVKQYYGHGARVTGVDCLTTKHFLSVGDDKTARYWSVDVDKHSEYPAAADLDCCCLLNQHGFLSGNTAGVLQLWSIARRKALQTVSLDPAAPNIGCAALALVPNSDVAFSATEAGLVHCWRASMADGGVLAPIGAPLELRGVVTSLKVSRSGRWLVVGTSCESRLGRWRTVKAPTAGVTLVELRHAHLGALYKKSDLVK